MKGLFMLCVCEHDQIFHPEQNKCSYKTCACKCFIQKGSYIAKEVSAGNWIVVHWCPERYWTPENIVAKCFDQAYAEKIAKALNDMP
jgi:hypothetical protein